MTTSRCNAVNARLTRLAIAAGIVLGLSGCGGSLSKAALTNTGGTTPTTPTTTTTTTTTTNPLTPGSMVNSLPPFTPTTSAAALTLNGAGGFNQSAGFGANAAQGYTGLGNILSGGLFMNPAQQGLSLQNEMGGFSVFNSELVPAPNFQSLANLGRSNEHTYMGGVLNVSIVGAMAEFFARHHDPNGTRHCLTSCQLKNESGTVYARIQSDYGGTSTTLGSVVLLGSQAAVECVNFKDTVAMYINGRLAIAAKDPQPVARQALFGVSAYNGRFQSLSAANLEAVRDANRIVFFESDFNFPTGSALPFQFDVTGGIAAVVNGEVVGQGGSLVFAQLRQVNVADIDVSMDFKLSFNAPRAGLIFRSSAAGHYRAEVSYNGSVYLVNLYRSNQVAPISGPYTIPAKPNGRIRVAAQGASLRVYVDNQIYAAAQDATFASGSLGMVLKDSSGDNFNWKSFY